MKLALFTVILIPYLKDVRVSVCVWQEGREMTKKKKKTLTVFSGPEGSV